MSPLVGNTSLQPHLAFTCHNRALFCKIYVKYSYTQRHRSKRIVCFQIKFISKNIQQYNFKYIYHKKEFIGSIQAYLINAIHITIFVLR